MARINLPTQIEGPDEIKINLVREDYLQTSNIFRVCFEICLAIGATILGVIIVLLNENKHVPIINWLFLGLMLIGCIAFLILTSKHYVKAKSQSPLQ